MVSWLVAACLHAVTRLHAQGRKPATKLAIAQRRRAELSILRSDYGFRNSSGSLAIFAAIRASFILMLWVGRAILAVASAMTLFVALLALASAMASPVVSAPAIKLPVLCWRY
jgi:hypothetical protein